MNRKIIFVVLIAIMLIFSNCSKPKIFTVGIVGGVDAFAVLIDGFIEKMTELGYTEGKNIKYDIQKLNTNPAGIDEVLKKMVADKVDLIVAYPTAVAIAAKAATQGTKIPVLFNFTSLAGTNLVTSLQEPGGNMTGVQADVVELDVKRFELLHEIVPNAKKIYIAFDPKYPTIPPTLGKLRPRANELGITLVETPIANPGDIIADLAKRGKAANSTIDAILILNEINNNAPAGSNALINYGKEHKIPVAGTTVPTMMAGAIFSYTGDIKAMGTLAAPLADKILKGTPAGTLPIVSPDAYLRINYKVTQELGIEVPKALMNTAVEIIK